MAQAGMDWRNIDAGLEIPTATYSDQPYVVKTDDGAWLCVMTTGAGREGQAGQHVVSLRSEDRGKSWAAPVPLEPADGPEASYAVLLKVPGGRVYAFYNHNTDNIRRVKADNPPYSDGYNTRVDSLGHYVLKYSDDHGRTWSADRYDVPMREMEIDRNNADGGALRYFWNVGKAFTHNGAGFASLHKVGGFGEGFFTSSEGVLLRSEGLLSGDDPSQFDWETLPDGDQGLRTPADGGGTVAEEHSYSVLSDGSFYVVYRTIDGYPTCAYSRDEGRTWSAPEYKRFADGRVMKHPRAANFAWRCENGKYLYWFHNHGGRFVNRSNGYNDRNPVWICAGEEVDGPDGRLIAWSQPEVVLYDNDPFVRMSYPDLLEDGGALFLTETQKDKARIHEIDAGFLQKLWGQFEAREVTEEGLVVQWAGTGPAQVEMPALPEYLTRDNGRHDYGTKDLAAGATVEVVLHLSSLETGQVLLDTRSIEGKGMVLQTTRRGTVEIVLDDGRTQNRWDSDEGLLIAGQTQHVGIVIDGGPKTISFIVDGALCDGGEQRQFGWGRFNPHLRDLNGAPQLEIGVGVQMVRVYDRALMTSEVIGNGRATQVG
ncbi:MAG: hypothetical protein HOH74_23720 [Gemmatimonadetes bacterium]|nr:hypothetical protein [Gemmatimonadota bacterium]